MGDRRGVFLIDYGATRDTLWTRGDERGAVARDVVVPLPGVRAADFLLRSNPSVSGDLAGIIGTDVLSQVTLQLDDDGIWISASACDPERLRSAGFRAIDQSGFFKADRPVAPTTRPLVPVVFLRIGNAQTWAQIDSGYEDAPGSHSVDINRPLFEELGRQVSLVTDGTVVVQTCEGREVRTAYRSMSYPPLAISDENGVPIVQLERYRLVLKPQNGCGGIAGMSEPAGQIGMSVLRALGTIVFEPLAGRVWIRPSDKPL